jgi:hypothetical protein
MFFPKKANLELVGSCSITDCILRLSKLLENPKINRSSSRVTAQDHKKEM